MLSTQYVGTAEANPLNYVLLYIWGKAVEDMNRGYRGSAGSGIGGGRVIVDHDVPEADSKRDGAGG